MSRFGKRGVRCDWCGKIANNENGEYDRPVNNELGFPLAGCIVQPEWERFPGGRTDTGNVQSNHDICEECAESRCPLCGSDKIVRTTPTVPGPTGWGGRCKDCNGTWPMPA